MYFYVIGKLTENYSTVLYCFYEMIVIVLPQRISENHHTQSFPDPGETTIPITYECSTWKRVSLWSVWDTAGRCMCAI